MIPEIITAKTSVIISLNEKALYPICFLSILYIFLSDPALARSFDAFLKLIEAILSS